MKSNCLAVLSVVLVLTMGSAPLFAGSQRASDVTGNMNRFGYQQTAKQH